MVSPLEPLRNIRQQLPPRRSAMRSATRSRSLGTYQATMRWACFSLSSRVSRFMT